MKAGGNRKNLMNQIQLDLLITEAKFQEIINDKLKLQYDKFENASIVLNFNDSIDNENTNTNNRINNFN